MSTPADAPYKLAQRAAEDALRRRRRRTVYRIDRARLLSNAMSLAAGLAEAGLPISDDPRIRAARAVMTRHERRALDARIAALEGK